MNLTPAEIERMFFLDRIEIFKNGIRVHRKSRFQMPPPQKRKGDKIYTMSKQSRMRLAHIVANCSTSFCSMLTLTYGDYTFPTDGRELKRQLNIFLNRVRARFGCQYLWFVEFTKRDHPHVHMLLSIVPNQFDRIWFGENWSEISVYDAYHRAVRQAHKEGYNLQEYFVGMDVLNECAKSFRFHKNPKNWQKMRTFDGATRYALKYAYKAEQKKVPSNFQDIGRFWGTSTGVAVEPVAELLIGETMSEEQANAVLKNLPFHKFELVPKYIFHADALDYFQSIGLRMTEIFGQFYPFEIDEKGNIVI